MNFGLYFACVFSFGAGFIISAFVFDSSIRYLSKKIDKLNARCDEIKAKAEARLRAQVEAYRKASK